MARQNGSSLKSCPLWILNVVLPELPMKFWKKTMAVKTWFSLEFAPVVFFLAERIAAIIEEFEGTKVDVGILDITPLSR